MTFLRMSPGMGDMLMMVMSCTAVRPLGGHSHMMSALGVVKKQTIVLIDCVSVTVTRG